MHGPRPRCMGLPRPHHYSRPRCCDEPPPPWAFTPSRRCPRTPWSWTPILPCPDPSDPPPLDPDAPTGLRYMSTGLDPYVSTVRHPDAPMVHGSWPPQPMPVTETAPNTRRSLKL